MPSETIAILGAGGFVGRWLHREIVHRGLGVWPASPADQIDIIDVDALNGWMRSLRPRAVVNLAAVASPAAARQAPHSAWNVNFQGTMNLAEAIIGFSPETRLVSIGSSEEYGATFNLDSAPVTERAPLDPTSTYGASKAAADLLVGQMTRDGLRAVRLRPFNHTGPGQASIYVVAAFARQAARIAAGLQPPTMTVGNLEAIRDFLDVRDVVRAYVDIALADDAAVQGRVFNLASGRGVRIGDILDRLVAAAAIHPEIVTASSHVRPGETPRAVGDAAAIAAAIGWSPRFSLDQTLTDVFEDWRGRVLSEPR